MPQELGVTVPPKARLLAGPDRLWVISSSFVGFLENDRMETISDSEKLGDISRPFLLNGVPAVVEERPSGLRVMTFLDGAWHEHQNFTVSLREGTEPILRQLQIVAVGDNLHLFMRYGGTLYHTEDVSVEGDEERAAWETVSQVEGRWVTVVLDNEPAVFCRSGNGTQMDLVGLRKADDGWTSFYTEEGVFADDVGVYPLDGRGQFAMLLQLMPGSFRVMEIRGSEVASNIKYGKAFPFGSGFMWMMFIPHLGMLVVPLVLAFILSSLMLKYRVTEYDTDAGKVLYASIAKRAIAQVIDALVLGGPTVGGWLVMMSSVMDMEKMMQKGPMFMFSGIGLMLGGMLWAIVGLLVFSFLEGKWGRTPGKWAMGIQVIGTDLQPCGFGRAFIRNLLKALDGFFNFMVGILLVALTEHWQRVGDMAARTVVIDVRRREQATDPWRTDGPRRRAD